MLNISRMVWQDALTLRYSNSASDKNLSQGSAGELLWNGLEVQLRQNAFHQISVAAPLTVSGSNSITLDTLWKPSTVTVGAGIQAVASDANGMLQLILTGCLLYTADAADDLTRVVLGVRLSTPVRI